MSPSSVPFDLLTRQITALMVMSWIRDPRLPDRTPMIRATFDVGEEAYQAASLANTRGGGRRFSIQGAMRSDVVVSGSPSIAY